MIETLLGAVVLVVACVFFVYGSGKANIADVSGGYKITAQFTDVGSLNAGDDVKISGVKIGTITDITLDPKIYNAVVGMMIKSDVALPYDTAARVSSEGLLGGTYMALDVGGDTEMLGEGDVIAITQSAQNLEQLLGKFIFSIQDSKKDNAPTPSTDNNVQ